MTDLLIFLITTTILVFQKQWISKHLQGLHILIGSSKLVATIFYSLLFLPGVIIHELSHFFMAAMLGVRTGEINFLPKLQDLKDIHYGDYQEGEISLGSVKIAKTDFIRSSLIGMAPFIVGSIAIYALSRLVFGDLLLEPSLRTSVMWLRDNYQTLLTPLSILYLYLLLAVANTMFMSKSDMRAWPGFAILLAIIIGTIIFFGGSDWLIGDAVPFLGSLTRSFSTGFLFAVGIDAILMIVILVIETVLRKIVRKRVVYS